MNRASYQVLKRCVQQYDVSIEVTNETAKITFLWMTKLILLDSINFDESYKFSSGKKKHRKICPAAHTVECLIKIFDKFILIITWWNAYQEIEKIHSKIGYSLNHVLIKSFVSHHSDACITYIHTSYRYTISCFCMYNYHLRNMIETVIHDNSV